MSTLRVNNITDTAGGSSSLSVPGAAEAWVNFNGTGTVAIRAALNVSSITDNAVGDYTLNFANALADANYASVIGGFNNTNGNGGWMAEYAGGNFSYGNSKSASILRVVSYNNAGNYQDNESYSVAVFR